MGFKNIELGTGNSFLSDSHIYSDSGSLKIGSNGSFNHRVYIDASGGSITIGDNVLIGPNTVLRAGLHNYDRRDIPINQQGHKGGSIVIEDDVWIAANVVVSSGVTLGRGAVIGAGSVVTKDIPPYMLAVGSPAKPIKERGRP